MCSPCVVGTLAYPVSVVYALATDLTREELLRYYEGKVRHHSIREKDTTSLHSYGLAPKSDGANRLPLSCPAGVTPAYAFVCVCVLGVTMVYACVCVL